MGGGWHIDGCGDVLMTEPKTEAAIMRAIQLAVSKQGDCRLLRNNVGVAVTKTGSVIRFGLAVGSSDLIGWTPVTITEDMLGKRIAVFCAVEVKRSPRQKPTQEQLNFLNAVKKAGGIALVACSVEEVLDALKA